MKAAAAKTTSKSLAVSCPYCKAPAKHIASSADLYGEDFGPLWICRACDAWCGCHPDGSPLGRLANRELRNARMAAHVAFDPLYENWQLAYPDAESLTPPIKHSLRNRAYSWLAHHLGISKSTCHFGHFDLETTIRAMKIIDQEKPTSATIRKWAKQRQSANQQISKGLQ